MAENNQKPGLSWSQPSSSPNTPSSNQSSGGSNNRPGNMQPGNKSSSAWWVTGGAVVVLALIAWAFIAARHAGNTTSDAGQTATTTSTTVAAVATTTDTGAMAQGDDSMSGAMAMPASTTPASSSTSMKTSMGSTPVGMSSDASQLTVPTPQAAGTEVMVSNIIVSEPTWVVVYEDMNGKPGNALGAALFVAGRTSGSVDLLRATVSGQPYLVTEMRDNGDHVFSLKDDTPVLDSTGQQIWVQIQTN